MLTFSYNTLRILARTVPVCPKPYAVGLKNIPKDGPIIYVYNHMTRRGEPLYLGVVAPKSPNIKFLAETTIATMKYLPTLRENIEDAFFSQRFQKIVRRIPWAKLCYSGLIDYLARYIVAQTTRIGSIIVDVYEHSTEEEKLEKHRTNKQALEECIESLENNVPLAIAPSGGKTYETLEKPVYSTIVPTLASMFYRQGKIVKIVPSIIKERPVINRKTYLPYIADRIFFYKAIRWLMNLFKIKSYKKPCLTVEFLPPLTFENAQPSKYEKVEFVKNLQQLIYDTLKEG